MALAERVRIPCMRRAAERRGLVVAWRRRRRFDWEVPLGPLHAIPPSAPAATPHALDQLVLAALAPTAPRAAGPAARLIDVVRVLSLARQPARAGPRPISALTLDGWCHVECIICFF
jgi:hypothetical protein